MPKKKILDIIMTVLLLFLMAYQVTGETLHEWIGIIMTLLVIVHQILNRKWYSVLFKGKYNGYRTMSTIVTVLLLVSFALTALCGMAMSAHAVPFMYGMFKLSFARVMHLAMSHWSFVLMGVHLGLHIPAIIGSLSEKTKTVIYWCASIIAGIGLYLFTKSGMNDYMLFRSAFAFLDYDSPGWLIILQNLTMLLFWIYIGSQYALLAQKKKLNAMQLLTVLAISIILNIIFR